MHLDASAAKVQHTVLGKGSSVGRADVAVKPAVVIMAQQCVAVICQHSICLFAGWSICCWVLGQVIDFFLSQKAALDAKPSPSPEDLVATTHALTSVRALLMAGLNRCRPRACTTLSANVPCSWTLDFWCPWPVNAVKNKAKLCALLGCTARLLRRPRSFVCNYHMLLGRLSSFMQAETQLKA